MIGGRGGAGRSGEDELRVTSDELREAGIEGSRLQECQGARERARVRVWTTPSSSPPFVTTPCGPSPPSDRPRQSDRHVHAPAIRETSAARFTTRFRHAYPSPIHARSAPTIRPPITVLTTGWFRTVANRARTPRLFAPVAPPCRAARSGRDSTGFNSATNSR